MITATDPPRQPGNRAKDYPASVTPSLLTVAWAAGIYEGEGACQLQYGSFPRVIVTQKDRWLLDRLVMYFGGVVYEPGPNNSCYRWILTRHRAVGFLMTIYTFLSPRRCEQLNPLLYGVRKARGWAPS